MAKKYYVKNSTGGTVLPVANGTLTTRPGSNYLMDENFETGTFNIIFFDANGEPVTPGAGTIVPEMSTFSEGQWLGPSTGDATIQATDVQAGSASYTMPVFSGPAVEGRLTFADITVAVSAKAYFWRA